MCGESGNINKVTTKHVKKRFKYTSLCEALRGQTGSVGLAVWTCSIPYICFEVLCEKTHKDGLEICSCMWSTTWCLKKQYNCNNHYRIVQRHHTVCVCVCVCACVRVCVYVYYYYYHYTRYGANLSLRGGTHINFAI